MTPTEIVDVLTNLSSRHTVAMIAACAERFFPAYAAFSHLEGWGNPESMRRALDRVWDALSSSESVAAITSSDVVAARTEIPFTGDYTSPLTSAAVTASESLMYALSTLQVPDPQQAGDAVEACRDGIFQWLARAHPEVPASQRESHEAMTEQLEFEHRIITSLRASSEIGLKEVFAIRNVARQSPALGEYLE